MKFEQVNQKLQLQLQYPTLGDWASTCLENLKYLRINLTFQEIINISKKEYSELLKIRINEMALGSIPPGEQGYERM